MSALGTLQAFYYSYLASPRTDRALYQAVRRNRPRRILELGIGTGSRAVRLIRMAQRDHAAADVRYTGLDLFESRTACDGPGITLKLAYRMLRATSARIQLLPGEPLETLTRAANSLGAMDMVVFSHSLDPRLLAETWSYIPRLLHAGSQVFVESKLAGNRQAIRRVDLAELDMLASTHRRAA
ncbi:MAG: hypothetical protein U1E05_25510 [Patescibacteria group bacterium]|nr:hypothetical protein [Patescibacteria group bacterium]